MRAMDTVLSGLPKNIPSATIQTSDSLLQEFQKQGVLTIIDDLPEDIIYQNLEAALNQRIECGEAEAHFLLGQVHFHRGNSSEALHHYSRAANEIGDSQACYQLGVMFYDGLGVAADHKKGIEYMRKVIDAPDRSRIRNLVFAAAYNLARAYYQGYGVRQSDEEAERWWLYAADDGNPLASSEAMTALGHFYSGPDHRDLQKAFFWHSEACGNGSLESQGVLGVMYLYGLGTSQSWEAALECLSEAVERGNVYAEGNLAFYFYRRKLFTKAADLAFRVTQVEDIETRAHSTGCLADFIRKGMSMAAFIYGRCLHRGVGVAKNEEEAKKYYSMSFKFDPDLCAKYQNMTTRNEI